MNVPFRRETGLWFLVASAVIVWTLYYGQMALAKHWALITGMDLAHINQAMWSTLQGIPLKTTTPTGVTNRLGIHVEPILLALVPLYALAPKAETLMLVQVVALALVAFPLYALARRARLGPLEALTFPALYVLVPAVHNAALADFYPVTLGLFPALMAMWAFWQGHQRAGLIFAILALMSREDFGLWLAALAVGARAWLGRPLWPRLAFGGLAWFLAATFLIVPPFTSGQESIFWARYRFWVESPEVWQQPEFLWPRLRYLLRLTLASGVGWIWAGGLALPALPAVGLNLLANFELPISFESYYNVQPVTFLLSASAVGFGRQPVVHRRVGLTAAVAAVLWLHLVDGRSPLVPGFRPPQPTPHSQIAREMAAMLPHDVPLSASIPLAPHVSGRPFLRLFPSIKGAEMILVDVYADRTLHPLAMRQRLSELLTDGWGVMAARHGVVLLARGAQPEWPAEFFAFVRSDRPPMCRMQLTFGGKLELQGYDLLGDYWGRPVVRLYWRPLVPLQEVWQPALLVVDRQGKVVMSPDTHPPVTLLWWPTWRWVPGTTYVVESLPLEGPSPLRLLVGVGRPLVEPATRLRAQDGRDLVPLVELVRRGRMWWDEMPASEHLENQCDP
ncbi:MAG: DUF2079 domain-containing protein [Ardenticatenia bacterium]|nr:DUF2079 domain-containing protein [Ardenticatenia bacterium]